MVVVGLGIAGTVHAEELEVTARRCTWLDDAELERLTRLELGTASTEGLSVDYSCVGNDVTIGLASDASGIRVERKVTGACCDDVEPERTLALLSLGLFDAARALLGAPAGGGSKGADDERVAGAGSATGAAGGEQTVVLPTIGADGQPVAEEPPLAPNPHVDGVVAPAPVPAAPLTPQPVQRLPAPAPRWVAPLPDRTADVDTPPPHHELGLGASLRLFNVTQPITAYAVEAQYRGWPFERIGFGAWTNAAFGTVRRDLGEIDTRVVQLGGSVDWRMVRQEPFSLVVSGRAGLALVNLAGEGADALAGSRSATGLTGTAALRIAPSLRSGAAIASLPLELGGLFRAPRGNVEDDDPVQLDGVTFSAGLAFAYGWGSDDRQRGARR